MVRVHVFSSIGQLQSDCMGDMIGLEIKSNVHAGHGMLGEFAAEAAGSAVLQHLAARLPATDISDGSSAQKVMEKAFKAAHETALQLYRAPPERYTYPAGSR